MRVEVEAFSDDAIACKDAIQVGPNYKPGGATFGAGTKTPIGARLVTYISIILKDAVQVHSHFTYNVLL